MKFTSPSKINFALWVKEYRSDGYHEIETVFYENKNLVDEVEIDTSQNNLYDIRINFLQSELNNLIPVEKNLTYKAAKLFFEKANIKSSCEIKINKRIPLQAGLGGGSSNAATVLKGLNKMFSDKFTQAELLTMGNELGADVPFFIIGGTCLAKGKGEILQPVENNLNLEVKIFKPQNISIDTKWAYDQIDAREFLHDRSYEIKNLLLGMKTRDYKLFSKSTFNDFETVVFSYYPELMNVRNKFLKDGYSVSGLCGSGSAVYGVLIKP